MFSSKKEDGGLGMEEFDTRQSLEMRWNIYFTRRRYLRHRLTYHACKAIAFARKLCGLDKV